MDGPKSGVRLAAEFGVSRTAVWKRIKLLRERGAGKGIGLIGPMGLIFLGAIGLIFIVWEYGFLGRCAKSILGRGG